MLKVDVREKRGSVVVTLAGELDCAEEDPCRRALESAPQDPGRKFIIDLSAVTFMDSTGIKLLLIADHSARVKGLRRPLIRGASARIMRVLDTCGVTPLLNIEPNTPRALQEGRPWSAEHPSRWGRRMATD